jgi:hypothetical protein
MGKRRLRPNVEPLSARRRSVVLVNASMSCTCQLESTCFEGSGGWKRTYDKCHNA